MPPETGHHGPLFVPVREPEETSRRAHGIEPAIASTFGRMGQEERVVCTVDGHGEDITARVVEAMHDKGSIVFRARPRLRRRKQRRLNVYCSQGHLTVVTVE